MRISIRHQFVMFDIPKSATTSITVALRGVAECILDGNGGLKHTQVADYEHFLEPLLAKNVGPQAKQFERIAVVREPMDMVRSYYRYLKRPVALNPSHPDFQRNTGNVGFSEYANLVCSDKVNKFSTVSRPSSFILGEDGKIGIDALFAFDRLNELTTYLTKKCGTPIEIPFKNVSPETTFSDLSVDIRAKFDKKFELDFALYRAVSARPPGQPLRARSQSIKDL